MEKLYYFRYQYFHYLVILQCLRWYLRYPLSYRNRVETLEQCRRSTLCDSTLDSSIRPYLPKKYATMRSPKEVPGGVVRPILKLKERTNSSIELLINGVGPLTSSLLINGMLILPNAFSEKALTHAGRNLYVINTDKNPAYGIGTEVPLAYSPKLKVDILRHILKVVVCRKP